MRIYQYSDPKWVQIAFESPTDSSLRCLNWASTGYEPSLSPCTPDNLGSATWFEAACATEKYGSEGQWCMFKPWGISSVDDTSGACIAAGAGSNNQGTIVKIDGTTVKCDKANPAIGQIWHVTQSSTD